ncbi:hypothetical protein [Natronobeatus ordinarius]|uniref:hypothetical protein n=1 Tax=Natronobeatus ordinarius TaxID=2963433 RepID=UPI0020CEDBE9|nr:hypothetical protein [Natronobeatus ordinarius]
MMGPSSRRLFVQSIITGILFLPGCLNNNDDEGGYLSELHLGNYTEEEQVIKLDIIDDGEKVHSENYTIGPKHDSRIGSKKIDKVWPNEADSLVVQGYSERYDEEDTIELASLDGGEYIINFFVHPEHGVYFMYHRD